MSAQQNFPLESYLTELDRALTPLSVSERARLVAGTQDRVERAMAGPPARSAEDVLRELGPAAALARRLLEERGIRPPESRRRTMRWVLAALALLFAASAVLLGLKIRKYFPIVKFDPREDHVTLLGGLIDVNPDTMKFKFGDKVIDADKSLKHFEGKRAVKDPSALSLHFVFLSGILDLHPAVEPVLLWKCAVAPASGPPAVRESGGVMTVDLHDSAGSHCEIWVPDGVRALVEGSVGKIVVDEPGFPLDARLGSGNILFSPAPKRKYRVDAGIKAGMTDSFASSSDAGAIPVELHVVNGAIRKI